MFFAISRETQGILISWVRQNYVMHYAIWYHSCNLKNLKNSHGGVLLLACMVALLHACFSRFLNCT